MTECIISIFLIIYCGLSMIFTIGLFIYHTKVISNNRTTKEDLKKIFVNPFKNPYSRNLQRNCQYILFPRLPPKSILDILKWDDKKDNINNQDKDFSIETENIGINHKNHNTTEKYSDINENESSNPEERIIPKFSFDLDFNNDNGSPL